MGAGDGDPARCTGPDHRIGTEVAGFAGSSEFAWATESAVAAIAIGAVIATRAAVAARALMLAAMAAVAVALVTNGTADPSVIPATA